jgi:hypothetical protein
MIDTVITDSAISLPKLTSDSIHYSILDTAPPSSSENLLLTDPSGSIRCFTANSATLLNHSSGKIFDHQNTSSVNGLKYEGNDNVVISNNKNSHFKDSFSEQENQNLSRIRTSDRLRLRKSAEKI